MSIAISEIVKTYYLRGHKSKVEHSSEGAKNKMDLSEEEKKQIELVEKEKKKEE